VKTKVSVLQTENQLLRTYPKDLSREDLLSIREKSVTEILNWIEKAASLKSRLLVLPELCLLPYFCGSQDELWKELAEDSWIGNTITLFSKVAAFYEMVLIVPFYEKIPSGIYHSSALVIEADGTRLGVVRKQSIPQSEGYWEKQYFEPGLTSQNQNFIFNTSLGRIAVVLGQDRFEESILEQIRQSSVDVVINPNTQWANQSLVWQAQLKKFSQQIKAALMVANRAGVEDRWWKCEFLGQSAILNSKSEVLVSAQSMGVELLTAELDFIHRSRDFINYDHLKERSVPLSS
jgi:N-carbamoylputrescine amidase